MWDCINCSGFGVADQRWQFVTIRFQITQLFSTTEVNSSHIIVQIVLYFQLEIKQNYGNLQGRFLCLRTEGAGGIMFPGCPSVRIFLLTR